MILLSTILDIKESMTKEAFIQLVFEWNQKSPHEDNIIHNIEWRGEKNITYIDKNLSLTIEEYRNKNIIAIRYEKTGEDGIVWHSDYIMNFDSMKMSIRLDREFLAEATTINSRFTTPYFIKLLIEGGYVKDDGKLQVLAKPILIDEKNVDLLINVINGEVNYKLPVIYISKNHQNTNPVNIDKLAYQLKGIAHILAQKDHSSNEIIKIKTNKKSEYNGAIGIYYPNKVDRHRRYLYYDEERIDKNLSLKILKAVTQYSNSQVLGTLYTWQGVVNNLLRDRLFSKRQECIAAQEALKIAEEKVLQIHDSIGAKEKKIHQQAMEEARNETNQLLAEFDNDINKLQDNVERLERTNELLRLENQNLKNKLEECGDGSLLQSGCEFDFYPGEIKDIVLSTLDKSLNSIQKKSRRYDIISDIINANDYQKYSETKAVELKNLLRSYSGLSRKIRSELEKLGFKIIEDGKHYKLKYYEDDRYQDIFAKTPSDERAGRNNATRLIKMVY